MEHLDIDKLRDEFNRASASVRTGRSNQQKIRREREGMLMSVEGCSCRRKSRSIWW